MGKNIPSWLTENSVFYILAWLTVSFFLVFINYDINTPVLPQWAGYIIVTGLAFPACWYASYKLTPRYLYPHKVKQFVFYVTIISAFNSFLTYLVAMFLYHLLTGLPMFRSVYYFFSLLFGVFFINVVLILVSCLIKTIRDRYFMEQQLLQIAKERVTAELNFLRSQVNPHFLFNVMNTIYFQIDKENTDARLSIEKFSEMIRYQLYECTTDKIEIEKELQYVKNYIAIQTLRMEIGSDIKVSIDPEISNFYIAPLLILPLVENAFKHVSNFQVANKNKIHLIIKKYGRNTLLVDVLNTCDQFANQNLLEPGGLGIYNLKRRLELLYPGRHQINIIKEDKVFKSTLTINYDDM